MNYNGFTGHDRFAVAARIIQFAPGAEVKLGFWERRRWVLLEVKNQGGHSLYYKVNRNSLIKRLGLESIDADKATGRIDLTHNSNVKTQLDAWKSLMDKVYIKLPSHFELQFMESLIKQKINLSSYKVVLFQPMGVNDGVVNIYNDFYHPTDGSTLIIKYYDKTDPDFTHITIENQKIVAVEPKVYEKICNGKKIPFALSEVIRSRYQIVHKDGDVWSTLKLPSGKTCQIFGKESYASLGMVVENLPLPDNLEEILDAPCPFSTHGEKKYETHTIFLEPEGVDACGFAAKIYNKSKKGLDPYIMNGFLDSTAKKFTTASCWKMRTNDRVPNTKGFTIDNLCKHIENIESLNGKPTYHLPTALEAAIALLPYNLGNSKTPFHDNHGTRCQGDGLQACQDDDAIRIYSKEHLDIKDHPGSMAVQNLT